MILPHLEDSYEVGLKAVDHGLVVEESIVDYPSIIQRGRTIRMLGGRSKGRDCWAKLLGIENSQFEI